MLYFLMPVETGAKMSLFCVARLVSGLVGAMLQSSCWRESVDVVVVVIELEKNVESQ